MAIVLIPAPDRSGGSVSDPAEYGDIAVSWGADGVLDTPSGTLLHTTLSGGNWETQPGRAMLRGHLFISDTVVSGSFSSNTSTDPRYDWVVARAHFQNFNDAAAPNGSITVVQGTAGGGWPAVSRDAKGDWDTPLLLARVTDTGAAVEVADPRVFVEPPLISGLRRDTVPDPSAGQRFLDLDTGFEWLYANGVWVQSGSSATLIEEIEVDASTPTVEFLDIPQGYRHLRLVANTRLDATNPRLIGVVFNGDTEAGWYDSYVKQFVSDGTVFDSSHVDAGEGYGGVAGQYRGSLEIVVPHYATGADKAYHTYGMINDDQLIRTWAGGGDWARDQPVTSIRLFLTGAAANWVPGSIFSLYGER